MKTTPPQLRLIATTWTLRGYPEGKRAWNAQERVRAIQAARFDGVAAHFSDPILEPARKAGLLLVGGTDIGSISEVEPKLQEFKTRGMVHINIQLCDHDTPTAEAVPVAVRVIETGRRLGLKPAIEVHRDTCTETPEKAYALADAYQKRTGKKLRMNFDHSHPAIIKHLYPDNYWPRLGVRLDLLRLGELIHFRPFNGHHCQIPITNGRGRLSPEFQAWLPFCDKVIEAWLQGARPGKELYVVPELGPKEGGYALSTFPDVWKDAIVVAREIRRIWNRRVKGWSRAQS